MQMLLSFFSEEKEFSLYIFAEGDGCLVTIFIYKFVVGVVVFIVFSCVCDVFLLLVLAGIHLKYAIIFLLHHLIYSLCRRRRNLFFSHLIFLLLMK